MKLREVESAVHGLKDVLDRLEKGGSFGGMRHILLPKSEAEVDDFIQRRVGGWLGL